MEIILQFFNLELERDAPPVSLSGESIIAVAG